MTDFSCDDPITLAFADRVGEILAELSADLQPQADYCSYMWWSPSEPGLPIAVVAHGGVSSSSTMN